VKRIILRTLAAALGVAMLSGMAGTTQDSIKWPRNVALAPSTGAKLARPVAPSPILGFIVGLKDSRSGLKQAARAGDASLKRIAADTGLKFERSMISGDAVFTLNRVLRADEAAQLKARLELDPSVAHVSYNKLRRPLLVPNETHYTSLQWHLRAPTEQYGGKAVAGGANLPASWDVVTGSSTSVVVAVIDTGYRPHADLNPNVLTGFDFIRSAINPLPTNFVANDGGGRDSDAQDPGDWVTATEKTTYSVCNDGDADDSDSSWHGTHVSGTIAAVVNNGVGVAGVARNAKILPIRALGKCGGTDSDIIDGMYWAAGIPGSISTPTGEITPPTNANVAKVINMSLGGTAGDGACSPNYANAFNAITAKGIAVVVAAGNDGDPSRIAEPSNCPGAIAVTSHTFDGDNSTFSNVGASGGDNGDGVFISAPGGGDGTVVTVSLTGTVPGSSTTFTQAGRFAWSTDNNGTTVPGTDVTGGKAGTSMATPHVAGAIAAMLGAAPNLTLAQIRSILTSSVRAFPTGTYCVTPAVKPGCGAGMLDVSAAVAQAQALGAPTANAGADRAVARNAPNVPLQGSGTGNGITYAWTQTAGTTVTLANANTANASFTAPAAVGTLTFRLTVTDNATPARTATDDVVITVATTTANAGADQTVTQNNGVALNGTASAPASTIATYAWTQTAGTAMTLSGAATATPTFTASTVGTFTFRLTVTDTAGATATDDVNVTVNAAPPPPSSGGDSGGGGGGGGGAVTPAELAALLILAAMALLARRRVLTQCQRRNAGTDRV
jgi:serine protease